MVARLIRTFIANALLSGSLLLREAGAAILPHDAPSPPRNPGNRAREEDVPPVVVPPEARDMIATGSPAYVAPEQEPLAGSLEDRRRKQALS